MKSFPRLVIIFASMLASSCVLQNSHRHDNKSEVFAGENSLPKYDVKHLGSKLLIDGQLNETAWQDSLNLYMRHPWPTVGGPFSEVTEIKLLWDEDNIYMGVHAQDKFMQALVQKADGEVYLDDCAEIFIAPSTTDVSSYLGFEFNINGTMLDYKATQAGVGKTKHFDDSWTSHGVEVKVQKSANSTINDDSNRDMDWTMEIKIPLQNFADFVTSSHNTTHLKSGEIWRANVFRCMGRSKGEFAIWSPTQTAKPDFHLSQYFGMLRFID